MRLRVRSPGVLVTGALLLGGIAAGFTQFRGNGADADVPRYTYAPVTRGTIVRTVRSTGVLTPLVSVEVSSQISGLVTEVNVDFNSPVKKGQVLARIDPSTFEQRLRQAEADLEAADANHALAVLNARRLEDLFAQELITQQEYDEIAARLRQSEATLLTRKAAVENARVDLERCTIRSPIDGIVIFKQVEVGKTVVSNMSAETLFTIAQDLSRMRIIASVSEVDIWLVRPGQDVEFTIDAFPERTFHGRVTQIRNPYTPTEKQQHQSSQQQTPITMFDAVIEVDNSDLLLRPGLTANVSIIVERREGVLTIPNGALRVRLPTAAARMVPGQSPANGAESAVVYRLSSSGPKEALPEPVSVRLGITDSFVTEVTEGLSESDRIVTGLVPERERPRRGPFSFF